MTQKVFERGWRVSWGEDKAPRAIGNGPPGPPLSYLLKCSCVESTILVGGHGKMVILSPFKRKDLHIIGVPG